MIIRPLDIGYRADNDRRARVLLFYVFVLAIIGALLHHLPIVSSYRAWVLAPFQPVLSATGAVRSALVSTASRGAAQSSPDESELRMNYASAQVRVAQLERDLNELRGTMKLSEVTGTRGVMASVTAGVSGFGQRTLVLDKGTLSGVRTGSVVLGAVGDEVGVVGRIIEAGPNISKVLTVLDPGCRISVRLHDEAGFVYSGSPSRNLGKLDFVSRDMSVSAGDAVYTAAEGSFFPADLLVGRIAELGSGNGVFHDLKVRPAVDLTRVNVVWIMARERGVR